MCWVTAYFRFFMLRFFMQGDLKVAISSILTEAGRVNNMLFAAFAVPYSVPSSVLERRGARENSF